jgi:hypothetical protein
MKRLICALAVASLTMMGCGGSLCQDFADSFKTLNNKADDCPSFDDGFDEPTDAEIEQCDKSLEACSDAEKELINNFIACVDKLPQCTASTEQSFATSFLACADPLESVSQECGARTPESVVRKAMAYRKAH